jgi:hypothetical protein
MAMRDRLGVQQPEMPEPVFLTEEEAWELFDAEARSELNMSGEEFVHAWNSGELDFDGPQHLKIVSVWMISPLARA